MTEYAGGEKDSRQEIGDRFDFERMTRRRRYVWTDLGILLGTSSLSPKEEKKKSTRNMLSA